MAAAHRKQRSQALVEFALLMPVMLFILLGLVDFGRAYAAGVSLEGASREGARLAIDRNQTDAAVRARIQLSAQPVVLVPADITLCMVVIVPPLYPPACDPTGVMDARGSNTSGQSVTVTVHTVVPFFTAFLTQRLGFSGVPVTASTSMQGL